MPSKEKTQRSSRPACGAQPRCKPSNFNLRPARRDAWGEIHLKRAGSGLAAHFAFLNLTPGSPIAWPSALARAARLTPESATLAMVALRVYADLLEQPSIETLGQPYEVAVVDAREEKTETSRSAATSLSPRPPSSPRSNSARARG
jgi:hypothetical protein